MVRDTRPTLMAVKAKEDCASIPKHPILQSNGPEWSFRRALKLLYSGRKTTDGRPEQWTGGVFSGYFHDHTFRHVVVHLFYGMFSVVNVWTE